MTCRYDPFGGLESQNGLRLSPYGFAGEEQTEETGHLFLRARTYDLVKCFISLVVRQGLSDGLP